MIRDNRMTNAVARKPKGLTYFEQFAMGLGRICNETRTGKRMQEIFLRSVGYSWVRAAIAHRMYVHGLDELAALEPERGVVFAANHRTFFDQYVMMTVILAGPVGWARDFFFPVRSNFFYERPLGVVVNFAMSAGTMYPPVFRQVERSSLNKDTIKKIVELLKKPGTLIGMHPEGTRNRTGDPYALLPAQPGIGELALKAQPIVIPVFVNGLTNNFSYELFASWRRDIRRKACVCVFGPPINYGAMAAQTPRPALYKEFSNMVREEILKLSVLERQIREKCERGVISDDDPGWLCNRPVGRFYAYRSSLGGTRDRGRSTLP